MKEQHIVLGNGAIGQQVYTALTNLGKQVILAGRSIKDEKHSVRIDALNQDELIDKTKDATHVHVTIGIPYNRKKWRKEWPVITQNIIQAATKNHFRIIFFDNVYAYGVFNNPATESHPILPISHKGVTRKMVYEMYNSAMNDLDIMIVRAPDFFGPKATNSVLYINFLENMLKAKNPSFIGSSQKKHSYAYTVDLGKAIALLSTQDDTYNRVWHLPSYKTDGIEDVLNIINNIKNTEFQVEFMSSKVSRMLSMFVPILKEVHEMRYQFDTDYVLDDTRFMNRFPDFQKTDIIVSIRNTIESFKS